MSLNKITVWRHQISFKENPEDRRVQKSLKLINNKTKILLRWNL